MTNRAVVRAYAQGQYGYITTADAAGLGVPAVELRKLAARGALRRVGHGLYRLSDALPNAYDQFAEAVLHVGPDAYLTHDAVLALHHLALVNPRRIRVGTPHRVRVTPPPYIELVRHRPAAEDLTVYEGIPATTVARALLDCRGLVMTERLQAAATDALREGLLTRAEASQTRRALRSTTPVDPPGPSHPNQPSNRSIA